MSSETISQTRRSSVSMANTRSIWVPYVIGIAAQLPMVLLYARDLWSRLHYQFFPVAVAFSAWLIWQRWPRGEEKPFFSSTFSTICLVGGLMFGLAGVLFVHPWFSTASVLLLIFSLLSRTMDRETQKSLLPCGLPLLPCLSLPGGLDMVLIGKLQLISANFTSRLLDLVGYVHHMPGTTIIAATGEEYGIAEACSGVTSFFMLVFCAIALSVWFRRPWFRALMLVVAAGFWAVFMNTLRIMAIPLADWIFDWNLTEGLAHDLLGYCAMIFGILLLLSTDQFIYFLFGPVDEFGDDAQGLARRFKKFWNRVISGEYDQERQKSRGSKRREISPFSRTAIWGAALLLLLGGLFSLIDVFRNFSTGGKNKIQFGLSVTTLLNEEDLPATIGETWRLHSFNTRNSGRGSDLGEHSDIWNYLSRTYFVTVSLDQVFPGWHELTTCYTNQGWEMIPGSRQVRNDEEGDWDYVEAEFEKNTGERAILLFSLFDGNGEGFEPPNDWGSLKSFLTRVSNRMSGSVRRTLFQGSAYQTQAFMRQFGPIDDAAKAEIRANYLIAREQMRSAYMAKQGGKRTPAANPEPPAEDSVSN